MPVRSGHPRAHRRWGQHFLVQETVSETIIRAFRPQPEDRVLEIGPGRGALTRRLLGRVGRLLAVEVDPDLASDLRRDLLQAAPDAGFLLVEGDVLETGLPALLDRLGADQGHPGRVIANLPYNIATAVILECLPLRGRLRDLVVMVQREVAERIASPPGRKSYGSLSVLCQTFSRVEPILTVGPGSFRPRPKVDSAVIRMSLRDPGGAVGRDPEAFSVLLRTAFEQRRTPLPNTRPPRRAGPRGAAPGAPLGRQAADALIRRAGLDPRGRAEDVSVDGFLALQEAAGVSAGPGRYNPRGDHAPSE
jgi:16S rRNA (adenine1518-N6/adenine1519-N6)-dimethyltransferase